MKGFYSPIDQLAAQLPRTKGTGAEFMTELSKRPGYKPQEAQDRELQTLMALPKMERAQFLEALKAKPPVTPLARDTQQNYHEEYTLPGGTNYREILLQHPRSPERFPGVSQHFGGAPNILASIRVKDRKGPNGEKVLHIEEIQSDWHQQGRDKGYLSPDTSKRLEAAKLAHLRLKEQLEQAKSASNNYERKFKSDMPLYQDPEVRQRMEAAKVEHNNKIMDLMPQVMKAEAERRGLEEEAKYGVPDAPFKKNWHELALKKMIHHAAANGYDSIAITPGQEQADRYGLAKQVAKLHYNADIKRLRAFNHSGREVISKDMTPDELPQFVGKEVASSLMNTPQEFGVHTLEGQNLNVGGAGMKGFYDKMIPSFLNQFGKKYGAQVGKIQVPVKHELQGLRTMGGYKDEPPLDLHHFPITPEMREDVVKNGVPLYADGGSVENEEPKKTIKAYKLFRVHPKHPGKLFPLFVDANTPVEMNKWIDAKEGEMAKGKVKSKIGPLAYRPGWHAGDLPIATHIGEKSDSALTAPDVRPKNHAWAEVEMPNDVDWQTEATKRGTNAQGRVIPVRAHITDQIPKGGHYRYKTNPNMTGNWLIGGSMKVNRVLADKEVAKINKAAGLADLPRAQPFKAKKFGFAEGGTVGPEEWMAEEHVNHKAKGGMARMAGGSIQELENYIRQKKGEYGAKRVQRAADEIPNLEHIYTTGALKQAFENKNAGLMTMNPADFEKFAERMREDITSKNAKRKTRSNEVVTFDDYLKHLADIKGGFDEVPLLELGHRDAEYLPSIEGHDGRHRSRVLTSKGANKSLVQLLPTKRMVLPMPKSNNEKLVQNLRKTLGEHGFVSPEGGGLLPSDQSAGMYKWLKDKNLLDTNRPQLPDIYAKGGSIKPIGYTKEKVTVSPNLDQMHYELINVKRFKKAK